MKNCIVIALAVLVTVVAARPQDTYTSRFDNIDVDRILKSDRLFQNYFNCLLGKGKCTPDGKELKKLLPDALKTNCAKCTEKQRTGTDRVLRFVVKEKPEHFELLRKEFDPEDIYIKKYRAAAKERGIEI